MRLIVLLCAYFVVTGLIARDLEVFKEDFQGRDLSHWYVAPFSQKEPLIVDNEASEIEGLKLSLARDEGSFSNPPGICSSHFEVPSNRRIICSFDSYIPEGGALIFRVIAIDEVSGKKYVYNGVDWDGVLIIDYTDWHAGDKGGDASATTIASNLNARTERISGSARVQAHVFEIHTFAKSKTKYSIEFYNPIAGSVVYIDNVKVHLRER